MNEESIFAAALERNSPTERAAFLDQACAGNAEVRAQVEELLKASDDAGSFLNHPPAGAEATIAATLHSGDTVKSGSWTVSLPFLEPCDKPDRIGRLDHYEIIEVVGHGGMGAVLRAFDTKLSRVVAVKVMAPELAANPTAVKRFLREATTAAAVHHDHVVTIHAVDETHRPPYLVMQFIDGQTLQQKIDSEGALELKQILRIGSQVAAGLAAAHQQGLIHRDVKPANVLLENGVERVKITDFGLARAADDLEMTQAGMIAGTPQYMSPEQAKGEPIDTRSDLFSLGSVLYTMCSGRNPFRADNTMGALRRVCEDTPRPIREVNAEIPHWLEAIVAKLLAKDLAERFQTAAEVADLLSQHLAHIQNPSAVTQPALVAVVPSQAKFQKSPKLRRWPRRIGIAAVVLLSLVAIAIWGNLVPKVRSLFHHELVLQMPDTATVIEIWQTDDQVETPNRWQVKGSWPFEPQATIANRKEKSVRLAPGNYWVFATRHGKRVEQHLLKIGWGGRQVLKIGERGSPLAVNVSDSGWVQLFNGKDLTGWKTHPDQPGDWHVESGTLIGNGKPGYLITDRSDFVNFDLLVEARINEGGDSGVLFGIPSAPFAALTGYEAQISTMDNLPTGSLIQHQGDGHNSSLHVPSAARVRGGEWFTMQITCRDNGINIQVKDYGGGSIGDSSRRWARKGPIAIHVGNANTRVEFRTIEIRELPLAPVLPDSAEQVLPALAGTWKGEYTQKIYGGKPDVKQQSAVAVNDWIVGQRWLRQRVQIENEGFQSVTNYEPNSKTFRDWFFHSRGLNFGPSTGRWDAATRTMTWTNLPEDGVILLMTLRFIDADTFTGEILIRDKEGNTVFEMASLMKRTTENLLIDETASAGPLPPEMAALDRLIGDWQITGVTKDAANPDGLTATWPTTARKILGGRIIAAQSTGHPGAQEAYSLSTYDTFSKAYARWLFKPDGTVLEYGGGWDEKTQTMKWNWAGKDGSQSTNTWRFVSTDRTDWQVVTKNAVGKTTLDFRATSIRQNEPGRGTERPPSAATPIIAPLDGRWVLVSAESQGKPVSAVESDDAYATEMLIKGDQCSFTFAGKQHKGGLRVDATNSPARIDFTGSVFEVSKPSKAIYELAGDRLRLCVPFPGPDADPPRPTEFKTDPENKNVVLTYRRAD